MAESVGAAQRPPDATGEGSPTAASGASPDALRLVSANVEGSLERFSDPVLLSEGKVNLISLQAVQDRFGVRWDVRKDQVYSFVERVMERGLGDQGLSLRVSETDFFVVQPDLGRFAGQMACLRYLREILHHFLGDSVPVVRARGGQERADVLVGVELDEELEVALAGSADRDAH